MKCPNCNNEVRADEVIDTEYYTGKYYDNVIGICSQCHKTWMWTEVFTFSCDIDVKEVTGE